MWVVLCSLRYMGGATGLLGWHANSIADRALYHYYCATACNATHGIAVAILSIHASVRQTGVL